MRTGVESETFDMPGYAIDDTSQYTGKEGVNYIDAATAWDREKDRLTIFVINRSEENEYPVTADVSGFEGYVFDRHMELYSENLELRNSFEEPDCLKPGEHEGAIFREGKLDTHVKPLSWNMLCFRKEA